MGTDHFESIRQRVLKHVVGMRPKPDNAPTPLVRCGAGRSVLSNVLRDQAGQATCCGQAISKQLSAIRQPDEGIPTAPGAR